MALKRALAYCTDLMAVYFLTVATLTLWVLAFATVNQASPEAVREWVRSPVASWLSLALQILYYVSYFTLSHWYFGASLGKRLLGLELVHQRAGAELGFWQCLVRSFAYGLSGQVTLGAGFLLALREDGLALHDHVAKTRVRERAMAVVALPLPSSTEKAA